MKTSCTLLALLLTLVAAVAQQIGYLDISEEDWKIVQTAADLSSERFGRRGPFDEIFRNRNVIAGLAQKDGRCYVAFKGRGSILLELVLPRRTDDFCVGNDCCLVQRKYRRDLGRLMSDIKPQLEACVNDYCTETDCTVITGHGSGGSIAALAAMSLQSFSPFGITFGELQTVETPCPLLNSERWWRIINSEQVDGSLVYDRVAARRYRRFPKALGHILLLSSVDSTAVAHMGIDRTWEYDPSDAKLLPGRRTEGMSKYQDRVTAITAKYTTLTYPVAPDGFGEGTYCNFGGECESRLCGENAGKRVCIA